MLHFRCMVFVKGLVKCAYGCSRAVNFATRRALFTGFKNNKILQSKMYFLIMDSNSYAKKHYTQVIVNIIITHKIEERNFSHYHLKILVPTKCVSQFFRMKAVPGIKECLIKKGEGSTYNSIFNFCYVPF